MNKSIKLVIGILLSLTILFFLFYNISKADIINSFYKVKFSILIFSIIIYFFIKFSNTLRYSFIYGIKNLFKLFGVLSFSNFILGLLPFRFGELSYIVSFKKYFSIPTSTGINKLFLIRLADYIIIFLLFLSSSFYITTNAKSQIVYYISLFFVISLILFALLFLISRKYFISINFKNKLFVKIKEYLEVLDKDFRSMTFRRIFILLLFTLIYWLLRIVMGYIILYSLGLKVGFIPIIFINGITILISLIPIQTIAGFGIFEFSWGYLLSQMGYVYDSILPIILVLHIIIFLTTALYGLIGFFILLLKKDNYAL